MNPDDRQRHEHHSFASGGASRSGSRPPVASHLDDSDRQRQHRQQQRNDRQEEQDPYLYRGGGSGGAASMQQRQHDRLRIEREQDREREREKERERAQFHHHHHHHHLAQSGGGSGGSGSPSTTAASTNPLIAATQAGALGGGGDVGHIGGGIGGQGRGRSSSRPAAAASASTSTTGPASGGGGGGATSINDSSSRRHLVTPHHHHHHIHPSSSSGPSPSAAAAAAATSAVSAGAAPSMASSSSAGAGGPPPGIAHHHHHHHHFAAHAPPPPASSSTTTTTTTTGSATAPPPTLPPLSSVSPAVAGAGVAPIVNPLMTAASAANAAGAPPPPPLPSVGPRTIVGQMGPVTAGGGLVAGGSGGAAAAGASSAPMAPTSSASSQARKLERQRERERERERAAAGGTFAASSRPGRVGGGGGSRHTSQAPPTLPVTHQQQQQQLLPPIAPPQAAGPAGAYYGYTQAGGLDGGGVQGWQPKRDKQAEFESLPANDMAAYYSAESSSEDSSLEDEPFDLNSYHPRPDCAPPAASSPSTTTSASTNRLEGNRGRKRERHARYLRQGKMYAWAPMKDDELQVKRVRKRFGGVLKVLLPLAAMDAGIELNEQERQLLAKNKRKLELEGEAQTASARLAAKKMRRSNKDGGGGGLRHLRSPSPPPIASEVAQTLTLPEPPAWLDLATSSAIRYTLGKAHKEKALMRTVDDLIQGENPMLGVLGRLKAQLELVPLSAQSDTKTSATKRRVVPLDTPPPANGDVKQEETEDVSGATDKPSSSTTNGGKPALDSSFLFGSGEPFFVPPGSNVTYEPVVKGNGTRNANGDGAAEEDSGVVAAHTQATPQEQTDVGLTPLQRLFVTPSGLTTTIGPSPSDPRLHLPLNHPGYPHTTVVHLTAATQRQSVIAALEKIRELGSDCREYVARLEEVRERMADLSRARRKVWQVIRERAIVENGGVVDQSGVDPKALAEEQANGGGAAGTLTMETRRRRAANNNASAGS